MGTTLYLHCITHKMTQRYHKYTTIMRQKKSHHNVDYHKAPQNYYQITQKCDIVQQKRVFRHKM